MPTTRPPRPSLQRLVPRKQLAKAHGLVCAPRPMHHRRDARRVAERASALVAARRAEALHDGHDGRAHAERRPAWDDHVRRRVGRERRPRRVGRERRPRRRAHERAA
eukprot:1781510-Prymnesium_polylepis.1